MPQTSVDSTLNPAVAGMLADCSFKDTATAISEEDTAGIPFGIMVAEGAGDDGALLPAATTDKFKGVSHFGHAYGRPQNVDADGLQPGAVFDCLRAGRVNVFPEDAVTPASEVHVRCVAAGAEQAGAFRGTADGTDTVDVSEFCQWRSSGDDATAAILEIDMTNVALAVADA